MTDAEHWARVLAAMDYSPTPDEELRTDARVDQRDAAGHEADGYHCKFLPSGEHHPELGDLNAVYEMSARVAGNYRAAASGIQHVVKEWVPPTPGLSLPSCDINDPALFVVFARTPHALHSVRCEPVEQLVARQLQHRQTCDWLPYAPQCASYVTEFLMLARGQYLVATAVCFACKRWLLAGAPDPAELR
ncbi:MAG: hypothetical protein ACPGVG_09430 [Mycobacterium sp.]